MRDPWVAACARHIFRFPQVDSDEAEDDSTSRSTETVSDEGADEAIVKKADKHGSQMGGICPEDDALRTEWRTHDHAAQLEAPRPWWKPRSYGSMLSRRPTVGREDLELRLARPIPENGSTNGPRTARAFSPVPGRTKRPNASPPLSSGVPQERRRDAAPAAPPPQSTDASRSPASAAKLSTNADAGNVPTSRLGTSLVSLPFLSVSAPCLTDVNAYGYAVEANQGHVLEGKISTHRHRVRLVTGHDMMSLLSLERLSLDAKPSGLKMSPDPMWHCRPAPLVVAAKASVDGCGQSSL